MTSNMNQLKLALRHIFQTHSIEGFIQIDLTWQRPRVTVFDNAGHLPIDGRQSFKAPDCFCQPQPSRLPLWGNRVTQLAFGHTGVQRQVPSLYQVLLAIVQRIKWQVAQSTIKGQHDSFSASLLKVFCHRCN